MQFPSTDWPEVGRAGGLSAQESFRARECAPTPPELGRAALGRLLARYRPALRAHLLRRRGVRPDEVDDLLQGFVADRVVADRLLAGADPARGRFRSYLLGALDHYVSNTRRGARALKRRPADGVGRLDDQEPTAAPGADWADPFEVAWARQLLQSAVDVMRAEYGRGDGSRRVVWDVFDARVLGPVIAGMPPPSYEQLCRRFDLASAAQASNLVVTARRAFARALRSAIAEYAPGEELIDAELRDLWAVLSRAGHRVQAL